MKYDADRVGKLSSEIYKALDGLEEISSINKDDFLRQPHIIAGAKYYFIVAIQASIDLVQPTDLRTTYQIQKVIAETFKILKNEEVLSGELTSRLMDMAKFRTD